MRVERPASLALRCAVSLAAGLVPGSSAMQFAAPGLPPSPRAFIPYTMRERL